MTERVLEDSAKYFWLRSGRGLRSLRELANTLPSLSEDEWSYHVKGGKNDFADWISDVFGERGLADTLRSATGKREFQRFLYTFLTKRAIHEKRQERESTKRATEQALIDDPSSFAAYHEQDADWKDALADRFDAFAQRFEENLNPGPLKAVEGWREALEERFATLRQRVAEARKRGKDPLLAGLLLRGVQSKIAYARYTTRREDFDKAERLLDEAERELKEALAATEPDVRKEVEALVAGQADAERRRTVDTTPGTADQGAATDHAVEDAHAIEDAAHHSAVQGGAT